MSRVVREEIFIFISASRDMMTKAMLGNQTAFENSEATMRIHFKAGIIYVNFYTENAA